MSALITLAVCALAPWLVCAALRSWFAVDRAGPEAARERSLVLFRLTTLRCSVVALPLAAIAGALFVDPVLATRWPTTGAWFFAAVCSTVAWANLALAQQTREERAAMPTLDTIGRSLQMASVPCLGVGLSLLASAAVEALVPMVAPARALVTSGLSVAAVVIASPWLAMLLGFWRRFPTRVESEGVSWRVAHLPAPAPFVTHAAALPWLRTVVVTHGLVTRAPDAHWRALVQYEIGDDRGSRGDRIARWVISISMSLVVFLAAGVVGVGEPRKQVAATVLAVLFTGVASWFANRQPASKLRLDPEGPSVEKLAETLRSLPPSYGQALPRTAHRPLGATLYDRLFALGHDPGRRPYR
jgi:hypothetical protein